MLREVASDGPNASLRAAFARCAGANDGADSQSNAEPYGEKMSKRTPSKEQSIRRRKTLHCATLSYCKGRKIAVASGSFPTAGLSGVDRARV
jgi:hypothetical protein